MLNFVIEKLFLTDASGKATWSAAPERLCEASGAEPGAVLALIVQREGGVQLGLSASFTNGQAVMLAQKGDALYALRAIPGA